MDLMVGVWLREAPMHLLLLLQLKRSGGNEYSMSCMFCLLLHLHTCYTPVMLELSRNPSWIIATWKQLMPLKWHNLFQDRGKSGTKQRLILSLSCSVPMRAVNYAHYLFISLSPLMIIRFKQYPSATASRAPAVILSLPLSLSLLPGLQQDVASQALFYRQPCPRSCSASPPQSCAAALWP